MNIEQIAQEVALAMSAEAKWIRFANRDEWAEYHTEYLRRCLSKLAEQDVEPVAYMTYKGYLLHAEDTKVLEHSDPDPLFDKTQLLAAQQRTAEACAKLCEAVRAEDGDGQHRAWYAGIDICIDAIRNGDLGKL